MKIPAPPLPVNLITDEATNIVMDPVVINILNIISAQMMAVILLLFCIFVLLLIKKD